MKKLLMILLLFLLAIIAGGGQKYLIGGQTFGQRYGIDPTGLVLWLDQSDPRSYGDLANWYDLSGNGNHGSQAVGGSQPAIVGADGLNGSARLFDGTADFMATDADAVAGANHTVAAWVKFSHTSDVNENSTIYSHHGANNNNPWFFKRRSGLDNKLNIARSNTDSLQEELIGDVVPDDAWQHVVYTVDGTTTTLYQDGLQTNQAVFGTAIILSNSNPHLIGQRKAGNSFAEGAIDIIQIFSHAFTAAEVQRLYLADKPRHGG